MDMRWLDEVRGLLIGRTIVDVVDYEVCDEEDPELVVQTGIVLLLDNGDQIRSIIDYEDGDYIVDDVTPSKMQDIEEE